MCLLLPIFALFSHVDVTDRGQRCDRRDSAATPARRRRLPASCLWHLSVDLRVIATTICNTLHLGYRCRPQAWVGLGRISILIFACLTGIIILKGCVFNQIMKLGVCSQRKDCSGMHKREQVKEVPLPSPVRFIWLLFRCSVKGYRQPTCQSVN